jgi:Flp pilus assembly CpaE family ATPase
MDTALTDSSCLAAEQKAALRKRVAVVKIVANFMFICQEKDQRMRLRRCCFDEIVGLNGWSLTSHVSYGQMVLDLLRKRVCDLLDGNKRHCGVKREVPCLCGRRDSTKIRARSALCIIVSLNGGSPTSQVWSTG